MISVTFPRGLLALAGLWAGSAQAATTLAEFQAKGTAHRVVLQLPDYPVTVEAMRARVTTALERAEAELKEIATTPVEARTFRNTFAATDAAVYRVTEVNMMISTIAESSTDVAMRDTANELKMKLDEWAVGLDYREDLYLALKAVADQKPSLDPQAERLLNDTMRSYRRAGLALAPAARTEVERLRKEVSALQTEFAQNVNAARAPLDFTAEQMKGVPDSLLESPGIKQADGRYRIMANVTWQAAAVMERAEDPETRRQLSIARGQLAREKNVALMSRLVIARAEIARLLGYGTWADYQTEVKMVRNGTNTVRFEEELVAGLEPKYQQELEALRQQKARHLGKADAKLEPWDIAFYTEQLTREKYAIDQEVLRNYFPYQRALEGMFAVYQKIFGLRFEALTPPYVWADGVQLYGVADAATGAPLGAFYLDMFPREGKYNHFACFPQKSGVVLPDGRYDLPVAALMCNFPAPAADKPSLLTHDDVVTLFHEFGHVMHLILARAPFAAQTAFAVPQDFVEAPSQMLEHWAWDQAVLDTFAADYRDPTKKIPAELIAGLTAARQATDGYFTRRQLSFGLLDLALHTVTPEQARQLDVVAVTNAVLARVSFSPAPDTAFIAYFGHLANGYDAGYYGYMWSKVIAVDMASVFEAAPGRYLDETVGRRLRDEIYGAGNTRDVELSVEKFLGRTRSQEAFLEYVGLRK